MNFIELVFKFQIFIDTKIKNFLPSAFFKKYVFIYLVLICFQAIHSYLS